MRKQEVVPVVVVSASLLSLAVDDETDSRIKQARRNREFNSDDNNEYGGIARCRLRQNRNYVVVVHVHVIDDTNSGSNGYNNTEEEENEKSWLQ